MNIARTITIMTAVAIVLAPLGAVGNGPGNGSGQGRGQYSAAGGQSAGATGDWQSGEDIIALVEALPVESLSNDERQGLLAMVEEEKLARDVYQALYAIWKIPVFSNIAASEQTHMDAVSWLLDRYNLADPSAQKAPGQFSDPACATLYRDLVARGSRSLQDAFTVGASVEDLDIADLEAGIAASDNKDVRVLYQNLAKASRNHLRSYVGQLERAGGTYTARHISPAYLSAVLTMNREIAPITTPDYRFSTKVH